MTTCNLAAPHRRRHAPPAPDALRRALVVDASVPGLNGLAYLVGAAALDGLLSLDAGWQATAARRRAVAASRREVRP